MLRSRNKSASGTAPCIQENIARGHAQASQALLRLLRAIEVIGFIAGCQGWRNIVGDLIVIIQHGGKILLSFRHQALRFCPLLLQAEVRIGPDAKIRDAENNRVLPVTA